MFCLIKISLDQIHKALPTFLFLLLKKLLKISENYKTEWFKLYNALFLLQTLLKHYITPWEISCHIWKSIAKPKKKSTSGTFLYLRHKMTSLRFFCSWEYTQNLWDLVPPVLPEWMSRHENRKAFVLHKSSLTPFPPQVCLAAWTSMKPVSRRTTWRRSRRGLCPRTLTPPGPPLPLVARTFQWVAQHMHSPVIMSRTPLNPRVYMLRLLNPGGGHSRIAHSRRRSHRRCQPWRVCVSSCSAWRHGQMSNHPGQERHGPRPLPHLLHAHGERGWQESECGPWVLCYCERLYSWSI